MFADVPLGTMTHGKAELPTPINSSSNASEDPEGYMLVNPGDFIYGHYRVLGTIGKGVYSSVVRAVQVDTKAEVAIKILRKNPVM